jgi:hypothetical protein
MAYLIVEVATMKKIVNVHATNLNVYAAVLAYHSKRNATANPIVLMIPMNIHVNLMNVLKTNLHVMISVYWPNSVAMDFPIVMMAQTSKAVHHEQKTMTKTRAQTINFNAPISHALTIAIIVMAFRIVPIIQMNKIALNVHPMHFIVKSVMNA